MTTTQTTPPSQSPVSLLHSSEISQISSDTRGPAECLEALVRLVRSRLKVDVCSTYLLEPDRSTLVLAATVGLNPESVGRVRMKLHEGITGMVAEKIAPIKVRKRLRISATNTFPRQARTSSIRSWECH
jgi:phosphotransferase system, enzyme I, PtsP